MSKLLKTSEIAERLNIHKETARAWCVSGKLPSFRVGSHHRVREEDLQEWIENSVVDNSPKADRSKWF